MNTHSAACVTADDVQQFLTKVQGAIAEEKRVSVNLPRTKLFARFETITIDYTFENFDEIEQLLRPRTPMQDGDPGWEFEEDTIVLPRRRSFDAEGNSFENKNENRFAVANQAHNADITLQEDLLCYEEFNDRDFEDERFPVTDDFFPDLQFPDCLIQEPTREVEHSEVPAGRSEDKISSDQPAGTEDGMAPEGSSDTPVNAAVGNSMEEKPAEQQASVEPAEVAPKSPDLQSVPPRARKRRGRVAPRILDFDNGTTIPAATLRVWLQDPSDLVGRESAAKATPEGSNYEKILRLPSTGLQWRSSLDEPASLWPPCLLELWNLCVLGRNNSRLAEQREQDSSPGIREIRAQPEQTTTAEQQGLEPGGVPTEQTSMGEQRSSDPENGLSRSNESRMQQPVDEPALEEVPAAGLAKEVVPAAADAPLSEVHVPLNVTGFQDYGSVEKLRNAINTPASQHDIGNELGLTPPFSGSRNDGQGSGWSKRRRSTPASAALISDPEIDLPTSERSKRRRLLKRSTSPALSGDDNSHDLMIASNGLDSLLPGSLTQFELLVDTKPSTQVADPKQSVDGVTWQLVQFLKDHFCSAAPLKWQSLNELTAGLERSQAAKLFYQVTVLTSNRYLIAKQEDPYGDILIAPGQYL